LGIEERRDEGTENELKFSVLAFSSQRVAWDTMKPQYFTARGGGAGTNGRVSSRQNTSRTRFGRGIKPGRCRQWCLGRKQMKPRCSTARRGANRHKREGLISSNSSHDGNNTIRDRGARFERARRCIAHNWVLSVSTRCLRTQKMEQQCTRAKWGAKRGTNGWKTLIWCKTVVSRSKRRHPGDRRRVSAPSPGGAPRAGCPETQRP
jgi:hypothetical protein